jgi:hypothetical protein
MNVMTVLKNTGAMTAGLLAVLTAGCVQTRQSEPKRTAVEERLLSRAADHALASADFAPLKDRKVYLDQTYYESTDKPYVLGAIRDFMSLAGALLMDERGEAEIIVEARSGALSIDSGSSLVGLPEMPVPIPLSGTVTSPEVPFYKAERQYSVAKLALLAYDAKTRKHVFSSGTLMGRSHQHYYRILGIINWTSSELPK